MQCEKPPESEGVEVTYDSLQHGSSIKYQCQPNYTYSPERNGICDDSGAWTISPPTCLRESFHIFIVGLDCDKQSNNFVYGLTASYFETTAF